ncbi:hypothetical protein [Chamaesiphon polymorphus]|uniref:hypothetical protein n=1 Tax=Chamaesiphon polymorphus TaxID=2107691 RepID=UPI0011B1DC16|nr:hypothetical protein [Chamaesiphon polymorphus]
MFKVMISVVHVYNALKCCPYRQRLLNSRINEPAQPTSELSIALDCDRDYVRSIVGIHGW